MPDDLPKLPMVSDEKRQKLEENLLELLSTYDREQLVTATFIAMAVGRADEVSQTSHGHVPASIEYLRYLVAEAPVETTSRDEIPPGVVAQTQGLLDEVNNLRMVERAFEKRAEERDLNSLASWLSIDAYGIRGSAYPEQTIEQIKGYQSHFSSWFEDQLGISPSRGCEILMELWEYRDAAIEQIFEEAQEEGRKLLGKWKSAKEKHAEGDTALTPEEENLVESYRDEEDISGFVFMCAALEAAQHLTFAVDDFDEISPSWTEWSALRQILAAPVEGPEQEFSAPIDVRDWPLLELRDGGLFLFEISHTLDVLQEKLEAAIKEEQNLFDEYQQKRGQWVERRTTEHLETVFGHENVFTNLTYPDPDKPEYEARTELDGAVKWGPYIVLVEVKSSNFRLASQLGDIGRLRDDAKRNVEEAFHQAQRALRYIESSSSAVFEETESGRRLKVKESNIERIFPLTISLHHLCGLASRLTALRDLDLFRDDEYPVSMSVSDLKFVAEFTGTPDVFLHYLHRRISLLKASPTIAGDELDFLGAYLDTRLDFSHFDEEPQDQDFVGFDGWSDAFDELMNHRRGRIANRPKLQLRIPPAIQNILEAIRDDEVAETREVAFELLDLPGEILHGIAQSLKNLSSQTLRPGCIRRLTHQFEETVITIVGCDGIPLWHLDERTEEIAAEEKYRRRAAKSLALGVDIQSKKTVSCIGWSKGEWEYDEQLENQLKQQPPFEFMEGQDLPGRNEPCLCGSGMKFKQCCLRRMKESKS